MRVPTDHGVAELVADPDRPQAWTLLVDGTAQSHVDLADPTRLEFEYVRRLAHVVDAVDPPAPAPLRAVHLGGGAWTLARYLAATRPRSSQRVLELDGALVDLVRARLPDDGLGIDVAVGDARALLARLPDAAADLVVLDVFAGARVPAHLTSAEFVRDVRRVLAPGGVHAANLADAAPFAFARAQVATLAAAFDDVALVASPEVLRGRRFGNVVLVAADGGLPVARVARAVAADPFPARVQWGEALAAFVRDARPVTDGTATPSPVPPPGFFGRPAASDSSCGS